LIEKKDELPIKDKKNKGYVKIDWGRQGGVILAYIFILIGYYGIVANTVMVDQVGNWISFSEWENRELLFWTYKAYSLPGISLLELSTDIMISMQAYFLPLLLIFTFILIIYSMLFKYFPVFLLYILILTIFISFISIYMLLYNLSVIAVFLLFVVCFLLTYKENIPQYGIKASLWLVPLLSIEGFVFYLIMLLIEGFVFTVDPFIFQFARSEGYLNVLILFACTFSGALSGMKVKQFINQKRKPI
jgi:hypothetical protein